MNFYSDIKSLNEEHRKSAQKFQNYSFCLNLIIDKINKREIEIEVKLIYILFIITKYEHEFTQIRKFLIKTLFSIDFYSKSFFSIHRIL